ncbi:protein ANTAGONIST OF LIKE HETEROCHROMATIN PROTEIN 1-like [Rhagoletis pomonella]|uniref:protein ANTAGONIST OF LIKE HETEROCHROMATIN PROTEIN 1-like n=1 Tax=Rhagoletis pomonella TaxID=28610 RepID=UPI00177CE203|nr:protein ANTAGONIST OF LIKE HETEROCHROMATIN PROTEIN 1-like [Rhagoletis pomonella]
MTPAQFAFLLEKVRPYISKQDAKFRNCIGAAERLQLTLRYLSTGETQRSLQLPFRIQQSTISRILKESIPAIYLALREEYLKFPASEQDWRDIAKDFYQMWGFPNCIGALDGKLTINTFKFTQLMKRLRKHCRILPVRKAGSTRC